MNKDKKDYLYKLKKEYILVKGLNKNGNKYLALADIESKKILTFDRNIIQFVCGQSSYKLELKAIDYNCFKRGEIDV